MNLGKPMNFSSCTLRVWPSPRTSQLAPNIRNNHSSSCSIIPALASNPPPNTHVLPHLSFSLSTKREMAFACGVMPEGSLPGVPPLPSDPPSDNWKTWLVGFLIATLLPFLKNKFGSLLKLKNEVEAAIETVDHVMEAVEKVAEEAEKVAEAVAEQTPAGSRLHEAATSLESVAKEAARGAHAADAVLDKVDEVEKEMELLIETLLDESIKIENKPNV